MLCNVKGSVSRDFWPLFLKVKRFSNSVLSLPRYSIIKSKILAPYSESLGLKMLGLVKLHFSYFKSIHPWQTCSLIKLFILIVPLRGSRQQESYCFWLRGGHCAVCTVQCAACSVQCALCSVQCAVCSVHCAVCTVQCALCTVHCALCSVQCAMCSLTLQSLTKQCDANRGVT